jgi:hypothetical protein
MNNSNESTTESQIVVSEATRNLLFSGENLIHPLGVETVEEDEIIYQIITVPVKPGTFVVCIIH